MRAVIIDRSLDSLEGLYNLLKSIENRRALPYYDYAKVGGETNG